MTESINLIDIATVLRTVCNRNDSIIFTAEEKPRAFSGVASGRAGRAQHDLNTQIKIQFSFQSELCPKNRAT